MVTCRTGYWKNNGNSPSIMGWIRRCSGWRETNRISRWLAFRRGEEAEDTLIRWIQRICQQHRSFEIALNNYSGIPPHTIYLRVQDPEPLRELMQQMGAIDEFIRSSGWPPVHLNGRPYLSIAGGLTEKVYNKAMPDYSRRTFHGIFQVE